MDKWLKNHITFLTEKSIMVCEQTFDLEEGWFCFLRKKTEEADEISVI